jgi:hypothetical protein
MTSSSQAIFKNKSHLSNVTEQFDDETFSRQKLNVADRRIINIYCKKM